VAAGTAAPARSPSPETYTPKHLAQKILTSKAALEGERKQVTVLFADVKGSMELLGDRDPEEVRKILDPVLTLMMDAVHHYEGTVNQVMGDGIMALFGAPLAHEDHAVRACYAGLRMQDGVRHYSEELRRAQGVEVQIRVGLNSGEVVVRSIGSDLRMDYSAVGQTTNLAARMEQLAAPGSIRLTAETLHLAEGFVQVTPLGPVPIKGLGEPVEVFELVGPGAARTRLEAAARRGLTRFVGRSAELEQLRGALDRASLGHGQVVAVVGEPGVGKSRLFWELTHSHRVLFEKGATPPSRSPGGWLILQSASVSYGKATAYLPVIELLRGYFAIESRDDPRKIREKVTGKVLTLAPALAPGTRPMLNTCSATSRPTPTGSTPRAARPTTARRWRWPSRAACAPSSPTATSASASSTRAWTSASRRRSISARRRRCTATWTCGSGSRRRRRRRRHPDDLDKHRVSTDSLLTCQPVRGGRVCPA
jgi:class 3 adenylate cyclase